jgi:hypothetical protein
MVSHVKSATYETPESRLPAYVSKVRYWRSVSSWPNASPPVI